MKKLLTLLWIFFSCLGYGQDVYQEQFFYVFYPKTEINWVRFGLEYLSELSCSKQHVFPYEQAKRVIELENFTDYIHYSATPTLHLLIDYSIPGTARVCTFTKNEIMQSAEKENARMTLFLKSPKDCLVQECSNASEVLGLLQDENYYFYTEHP